MADEDRPNYSFGQGAPADVTTFFENRGLRPAFSWEDVEPEEHAVAFTVAKAMDLDVLETIQTSLSEALENGVPYREWARNLRPELERRGWWGRREMVDPDTGDVREVQLGSPRRLRTIYQSNMRSARAAGQWARIERTAAALPYLLYLLGPSERHRPHHAAKEGIVLPVDDPFWRTWFPPNGWGCKCHVRQITRREAERRGISQSPERPTRPVVNTRTGEVREIPAGIDPGWEDNPGLRRQERMQAFMEVRLTAADPEIARVAARDMATSWRARRILDGSAHGSVVVAQLPDALRAALGTTTGNVQFTSRSAEHILKRDIPLEALSAIPDAVDSGHAAFDANPRGAHRLVLETKGSDPWRIVLNRDAEGVNVFVNTMHRTRPGRALRRAVQRGFTILRE